MYCTRCGEKLKEDNLYCPACGHKIEERKTGPITTPLPEKKPMPSWFKGLIIIALLALIAVTVGIFFAQNPKKTIEDQLKAMQKSEFNKAYYKTMAQEFQEMTAFDEFIDFVHENPILQNFLTFRLGKSHVQNDIGIVKATLIDEDGEATVVEYQLRKENGKWKVFLLHILGDERTFSNTSPEEQKEIVNLLEYQFSLFKDNKIEEAYEKTTSTLFQEVTSFDEYQQFLKEHPLLIQERRAFVTFRGKIDEKILALVLVQNRDKLEQMEYVFIEERDQWRIWRQNGFPPFVSIN